MDSPDINVDKLDKKSVKQGLPVVAAVIGGASLLLLRKLAGSKKTHVEMHHHDSLDHMHDHVHVTHNRSDEDKSVGGWQHLTASHSHRHNHASITHTHRPHRDFEGEHRTEAHVHDHDEPFG